MLKCSTVCENVTNVSTKMDLYVFNKLNITFALKIYMNQRVLNLQCHNEIDRH